MNYKINSAQLEKVIVLKHIVTAGQYLPTHTCGQYTVNQGGIKRITESTVKLWF